MIVGSKFDLGQYVYSIFKGQKCKLITCKTCHGGGRVMIEGKSFLCPNCNGRRTEVISIPSHWHINQEGTVGRIDIEIYEDKEKCKKEYMLYESGVGSGTIYQEENLFASIEDAENECEKRNIEDNK